MRAPGGWEGAPLCYEFHADFDIIHHLRNAMGFAFPPIRGLGSPPAPERASRLRSRREIPQSFQFGFTLFLAASRRAANLVLLSFLLQEVMRSPSLSL